MDVIASEVHFDLSKHVLLAIIFPKDHTKGSLILRMNRLKLNIAHLLDRTAIGLSLQ